MTKRNKNINQHWQFYYFYFLPTRCETP